MVSRTPFSNFFIYGSQSAHISRQEMCSYERPFRILRSSGILFLVLEKCLLHISHCHDSVIIILPLHYTPLHLRFHWILKRLGQPRWFLLKISRNSSLPSGQPCALNVLIISSRVLIIALTLSEILVLFIRGGVALRLLFKEMVSSISLEWQTFQR